MWHGVEIKDILITKLTSLLASVHDLLLLLYLDMLLCYIIRLQWFIDRRLSATRNLDLQTTFSCVETRSGLYIKSSLPIGLSEFWESEPIGTCKNINPIHDQGCGYHYLDDRPSKWGFPLTLTKTTWIFNFYCTAVFLKAIQLP